ncbi:hypothetical protein UVI_02015310 [Ustilaginoidea virens]|nr:hypothetical protein UVI_02015310 [Ustilaginoidea virens]
MSSRRSSESESDDGLSNPTKRATPSKPNTASTDTASENEFDIASEKSGQLKRHDCPDTSATAGPCDGGGSPLLEKTRPPRPKQEAEKPAAESSAGPSGPRIQRMARKGVRCKEVFGFVPVGEEQTFSAPFATAAASRIGVIGRPPSAPHRPPGISLMIKPQAIKRPEIQATKAETSSTPSPEAADDVAPRQDERSASAEPGDKQPCRAVLTEPSNHLVPEPEPEQSAANPQPQPPPPPQLASEEIEPTRKRKIANPATRGRKAARKQDAAGQAPQNVVPFEASLPGRVPLSARLANPKVAPSLPGFSRASGGAWSKHAEDLLGMTRPTRKL